MAETPISFITVADLNSKVEVIGLKDTTAGVSQIFKSCYFTRECLEAILSDSSCADVRFYLVAHDLVGDATTNRYPTMMAVGETSSFSKSGSKAYISNKPCPPYCPKRDEEEDANKTILADIILTTPTTI